MKDEASGVRYIHWNSRQDVWGRQTQQDQMPHNHCIVYGVRRTANVVRTRQVQYLTLYCDFLFRTRGILVWLRIQCESYSQSRLNAQHFRVFFLCREERERKRLSCTMALIAVKRTRLWSPYLDTSGLSLLLRAATLTRLVTTTNWPPTRPCRSGGCVLSKAGSRLPRNSLTSWDAVGFRSGDAHDYWSSARHCPIFWDATKASVLIPSVLLASSPAVGRRLGGPSP